MLADHRPDEERIVVGPDVGEGDVRRAGEGVAVAGQLDRQVVTRLQRFGQGEHAAARVGAREARRGGEVDLLQVVVGGAVDDRLLDRDRGPEVGRRRDERDLGVPGEDAAGAEAEPLPLLPRRPHAEVAHRLHTVRDDLHLVVALREVARRRERGRQRPGDRRRRCRHDLAERVDDPHGRAGGEERRPTGVGHGLQVDERGTTGRHHPGGDVEVAGVRGRLRFLLRERRQRGRERRQQREQQHRDQRAGTDGGQRRGGSHRVISSRTARPRTATAWADGCCRRPGGSGRSGGTSGPIRVDSPRISFASLRAPGAPRPTPTGRGCSYARRLASRG